ncbi:MAG TPA: cache domain-containing protein [Burkholderiales bacterium]|nr:cache domain-containing protein [Burkholderiales bacterium]
MTVRALVVVMAVLPFAVVGIVAASLAAEDARVDLRSRALASARATVNAVDAELQAHIRTVESLATSRNLERGDVRAFYEESRRVLLSQARWLNIGLQSTSGKQLFNAIAPFGSPLPPQVDEDSLQRALESGKPQIGNIAVGPAIERPATRLRVPVATDGKLQYVISVPLKPQLFEELLRRQPLPEQWSISLLDGKRRLVASVPPQPPGIVGEQASPEVRRKPATEAREGFVPFLRPDGTEIYAGYVTSPMSGWTVTVSLSKEILETAAWEGARPIVIGLVSALSFFALILVLLRRLLVT